MAKNGERNRMIINLLEAVGLRKIGSNKKLLTFGINPESTGSHLSCEHSGHLHRQIVCTDKSRGGNKSHKKVLKKKQS